MKDQINSRIIILETTVSLTLATACIFIFTKAAPGVTASCSALLDNMAYSFEQWIAGASFLH